MPYRKLYTKHTISLVTDIQASCIFYLSLLSKYFPCTEHLLLQKHRSLHSCLKKQFQVFLIKQPPSLWKKVLRLFSVKQLFSIYGRNGRGKRNIYHIGKHSMLRSFANKRQKQQPRVDSRGSQQRQDSGATSCFYRPTDNVLKREEQLPLDDRHTYPP